MASRGLYRVTRPEAQTINLTHAAALALVGWYLMVPPSVGPYRRLDYAAPISRWNLIQSFDTPIACEDYLQQQNEETVIADATIPNQRIRMTVPQEMVARCVFSDNPRLKP
jgi:hypothetical protein